MGRSGWLLGAPQITRGAGLIPAGTNPARRLRLAALGFTGFLLAAGCQVNQPQVAPPQVQVVPVSKSVERQVTDYVDFTGRTNAVETVNIIPRVTGYLVKIPFKEGSEVRGDDRLRGGARVVGQLASPWGQGPLLTAAALFPGQCQEGSLLFQIDPRPYKAQLDQAEGQVKLYKAKLQLAKTTLARDIAISKTPGAVSLQQLDQDRASVEEAEASLNAAEASTEVYKLNLDFTNVSSPVNGQVSRHYLSLGNLVNQDQTLLTTVVSLDPMYVYFDMDDPTLLRIRKAINEGKVVRYQEGKIPVLMALQGEDDYRHAGTINFVDNQVSPTTGSISVRGIFPNIKPPNGVRLLSPGMFVRIRLPIGQPHQALLVIDRAIGSDQGLKYVYVVDDKNVVQSRRVTTGALQPDGLRVITEGLNPGDWVVVAGLQQVRPRTTVQLEPIPMPSFNQPAAVKAKGTGDKGKARGK
jgi:membrane fusion protein, multidrug efflux system